MDPYYQNNDVILYKGDCLQVMPELDIKFDACITDPPYGTTACKWDSVIPFEPMWEQLKRLVKSNGAICLFGSEPFSSKLRCSNMDMFKYDWVWAKSKASNFLNARKIPLKVHEIISVFYREYANYNPIMEEGQPFSGKFRAGKKGSSSDYVGTVKNPLYRNDNNGTRFPRSIQYFATAECEKEGSNHPTAKPVNLLEYLIRTYTNEGETVLDFTAGSGTTGVAAMNTNRKCVLIEREGKYCDIIIQRLKEKELEIAERLFR